MRITIEAIDWRDAMAQVQRFAAIREPALNVAKNDPAPGDTAKGDPALRGIKESPEDLKPSEPAPSLEEARDALRLAYSSVGEDRARALLREVGATKASDVPELKRKQFIESVNKAVTS